MMKPLILAVVVAVATASPYTFDPELSTHWQKFKTEFSKVYEGPQEDNYRRMIFEKNMKFIRDHNMEADLGQKTFRVGVNEYADRTELEFSKMLTGYSISYSGSNVTARSNFVAPNIIYLPSEVDWRKQGYVTDVKNQKHCGSCWAFSATGSLEGQHFKKTKKLISLSEQNLVDCSKPQGNKGCQGGRMDQAFMYILETGGIDTEQSYPYEAQNGPCRFKPGTIGATCTGYTDVKGGDEHELQKAVAMVGPISVGIDASHQSFHLYKSGVYYEEKCSTSTLDHGVLAVGYGTADKQHYWLVKNSWGATWGMSGYIQMSRNRDNNCGIATHGSYPLV